jgi:hypothetical protein
VNFVDDFEAGDRLQAGIGGRRLNEPEQITGEDALDVASGDTRHEGGVGNIVTQFGSTEIPISLR